MLLLPSHRLLNATKPSLRIDWQGDRQLFVENRYDEKQMSGSLGINQNSMEQIETHLFCSEYIHVFVFISFV